MKDAVRRELGAFLRASRDLVGPHQVGLPVGGRRRAPGLRREEVAVLAGVSVAWYTWLEQGRVAVSRQVIDAVCTALRMPPHGRRHALALAGFLPDAPAPGADRAAASPMTVRLIEAWPDTPALLLDERLDILAGNSAYRLLWGDPSTHAHGNLILHLAADPPAAHRVADPEPLLQRLYQQFRTTAAHLPNDPRIIEITDLLTTMRPHLTPQWRCPAAADFPPTSVEVASATGEHLATLTFALLRPLADPGVLVLTQTPAGPPGDQQPSTMPQDQAAPIRA